MSFVRDIGIDADSEAIIRAVIRLARDVGIRTAAEGVETAAQYDWLVRHRCTEVQGYYYSRPLAETDLRTLLERTPQRRGDAPDATGTGASTSS